jgi:hypothetical protein
MDASYRCAVSRIRAGSTWNQLLIHASARRVVLGVHGRELRFLLVVRIEWYPGACQHHRLKQSCARDFSIAWIMDANRGPLCCRLPHNPMMGPHCQVSTRGDP